MNSMYNQPAFLITALSCNMHKGWDPSLHDSLPHRECCGPDKKGNAFVHLGNMEKIIHDAGLPITWFIDPPTAREHLSWFRHNAKEYGDEIGFMPSSVSHFNPVNYNTEKTLEETVEFLRKGLEELQYIFQTKITTVAIDQFIGSLGTNFVEAAVRLNINALWGMGFDHYTCDTSMYHGGCPWNPYRPDKNNFRIPGDDPLSFWIFQWTFRDLINSVRVPGGASGAVMFSTDVDDILASNIVKHQPDYYHRMVTELLKNKQYNDFLCVTIHQEDHDSWNREGCAFYEHFFKNRPEGLTPVTMGQAASWLDRKYPHPTESKQMLRLEDPLLCKDEVKFIHPDIKKPADWPQNGEIYPPHVFYYDKNIQIILVEGENRPYRFIDYRKQYPVLEMETYPQENLPKIQIHHLHCTTGKITYKIQAEQSYEGFPLALWENTIDVSNSLEIPGGFVIFIDLKKGMNTGTYL